MTKNNHFQIFLGFAKDHTDKAKAFQSCDCTPSASPHSKSVITCSLTTEDQTKVNCFSSLFCGNIRLSRVSNGKKFPCPTLSKYHGQLVKQWWDRPRALPVFPYVAALSPWSGEQLQVFALCWGSQSEDDLAPLFPRCDSVEKQVNRRLAN